MDYERIYSEFIADRLTKQPAKPAYFEKHHIVPRSLGGGDEKSNIIRLSMEDHIHAHILLGKIHGGKMWGAALLMLKSTIGRTRSVSNIPTKGEILAAAFARRMFSAHCRGENHSQWGRKHTVEAKAMMSQAHSERAAKGMMWTQNNQALISGDNHWTKQAKNAEALEKAVPIFKANLIKAALANTGAGNPMHRPEVQEKLRKSQRQHWENGTGAGSEAARLKRIAAHSTPEYLSGARERVLGAKNHNFGLGGGKNYNSRQVLCVEQNRIFDSVKEAVVFCGGDVTKAARTGGKAGGYTWRRLTAHKTDGRQTKKHEPSLTNPVRPGAKEEGMAQVTG